MTQFTQNKLHSLYPVYILPVYMCIFMPIMKFSHFTNVFIFFSTEVMCCCSCSIGPMAWTWPSKKRAFCPVCLYSYKLLFSGFHKQLSCTLMYIIVKYWGYIHAIPPFQNMCTNVKFSQNLSCWFLSYYLLCVSLGSDALQHFHKIEYFPKQQLLRLCPWEKISPNKNNNDKI